jgi:hypothetical protein
MQVATLVVSSIAAATGLVMLYLRIRPGQVVLDDTLSVYIGYDRNVPCIQLSFPIWTRRKNLNLTEIRLALSVAGENHPPRDFVPKSPLESPVLLHKDTRHELSMKFQPRVEDWSALFTRFRDVYTALLREAPGLATNPLEYIGAERADRDWNRLTKGPHKDTLSDGAAALDCWKEGQYQLTLYMNVAERSKPIAKRVSFRMDSEHRPALQQTTKRIAVAASYMTSLRGDILFEFKCVTK